MKNLKNLTMKNVLFSYTEDWGKLPPYVERGDKFVHAGVRYVVRRVESFPRYLDGGKTAYEVQLTAQPIRD
jgi:hypothetical protein